MMNMSNKYLKISDLSLVTALSLLFPIESTELVNNNKVIFVFLKSTELDMHVDSYWRGEMRVEPQRFFNQLKVIKTRIRFVN